MESKENLVSFFETFKVPLKISQERLAEMYIFSSVEAVYKSIEHVMGLLEFNHIKDTEINIILQDSYSILGDILKKETENDK